MKKGQLHILLVLFHFCIRTFGQVKESHLAIVDRVLNASRFEKDKNIGGKNQAFKIVERVFDIIKDKLSPIESKKCHRSYYIS